MNRTFADRAEAGRLLARKLARYVGRPDVLVLALPRGGVPVGYEIARELHAPLDVFLVRKLGLPGHEELAMGALATGGVRVLNREVVERLEIPAATIEAIAAREALELARRELAYRGHAVAPLVRGRVVLLVDDGIATGSTMKAAVRALSLQHPARIVVVAPVIALSTFDDFARENCEVVTLMTPAQFMAVGEWYEDFAQVSDEEVTALLEAASGFGLRAAQAPKSA